MDIQLFEAMKKEARAGSRRLPACEAIQADEIKHLAELSKLDLSMAIMTAFYAGVERGATKYSKRNNCCRGAAAV